uniref:hypothetical protein n=1 Tax=Lachnospira sp. TaxID=2049031 RepID=UPI003FEECF34
NGYVNWIEETCYNGSIGKGRLKAKYYYLQSYFINPLLETAYLCYYNSCGFMYIHKAAKVICYI